MALKQRAEQAAHTESLDWEEEEEGELGTVEQQQVLCCSLRFTPPGVFCV